MTPALHHALKHGRAQQAVPQEGSTRKREGKALRRRVRLANIPQLPSAKDGDLNMEVGNDTDGHRRVHDGNGKGEVRTDVVTAAARIGKRTRSSRQDGKEGSDVSNNTKRLQQGAARSGVSASEGSHRMQTTPNQGKKDVASASSLPEMASVPITISNAVLLGQGASSQLPGGFKQAKEMHGNETLVASVSEYETSADLEPSQKIATVGRNVMSGPRELRHKRKRLVLRRPGTVVVEASTGEPSGTCEVQESPRELRHSLTRDKFESNLERGDEPEAVLVGGTVDEQENMPIKRRGPGRPRKNQREYNLVERRGRGRPKKKLAVLKTTGAKVHMYIESRVMLWSTDVAHCK